VPGKSPKQLRLFFGILPDKSCQLALRKSLTRLPHIHARAVPRGNHHITLVFLGNIPEDLIPCFKKQAADITFRPFSLVLDHLGSFKRARVLWMGTSELPRELLRLHDRLNAALSSCGFEPEERKYRPHLTLYRKFTGKLPQIELKPVRWEVRSFHLMVSESTEEGVRYRSLASFPAR
jgi:2'-5' RNA ligase